MQPVVSVVIPILNEEAIARFTTAVSATLRDAGHAHEIVLVNDGAPVAVEGARVIEGSHRGKGRAVGDGIRAATGDVVIVLDADMPMLLPLLPQFVALIRSGNDLAIAERQFDYHQRKPIRFLLSFGLLVAQRLFIFQSFRFADTQCGFKAFRAGAARAIAAKQHVDGGMYDIEYLYIAVRNRMRIATVPVGHVAEQRPSRIDLLSCLRTDPAALAGVKLRGLLGRYKLRETGESSSPQ